MKGRFEDRRLVTGRGRYAADWTLPGQAYAAFLRADHAHAEIVRIDSSRALAMPGVLAVLTGADMLAEGIESLPTRPAPKSRDGRPLARPLRPALARGKVNFVGEPVVVVIAESTAQAVDAVEQLEVEYRDLPVVLTPDAALAPGAAQLHDAVPGNFALDFGVGNEEATAACFRGAKHVVRVSFDNTRVIAHPMETRSCLVRYEAGHYTIHTCTQGVNNQRAQLEQSLGLEPGSVTVIAEDVGGGFGVRSNATPEYLAVMVAAKRVGRPVKWTSTRSETFLGDEQARDAMCTAELALDADHRFLAMRFDYRVNLGAYLSQTGAFLATQGLTACVTGVYDLKAVYARSRLAYTNTAPTASYRGAGRPLMSYMLERLVDEAAVELGVDPAALRRRNLVPTAAFPYRTAGTATYDCGDFVGVFDDCMRAADWAGYEARRAASAARGMLRGRGIASFVEATAGGVTPIDEVELRFAADAGLTLFSVSHSQGQGHATAFAQIVGGALGLDPATIGLKQGQQGPMLEGNGTGGSRTLLAVGSALHRAAETVIQKGYALASEHLEAPADDLEFDHGTYRIKGTDRQVSLQTLVRAHAGDGPHPLDTRTEVKIGPTFPNGCHVAEVEIDPSTGRVTVERYVAVDDAGNIINHQLVEGQMVGGIAQAAGQVFGEHVVHDPKTGQLLTGSFMDYPMPRAGFAREIVLGDHPVPTATNPLGAKGVGEAGTTGALPALMNAVADALRSRGVKHFEMPATPARVWMALAKANA